MKPIPFSARNFTRNGSPVAYGEIVRDVLDRGLKGMKHIEIQQDLKDKGYYDQTEKQDISLYFIGSALRSNGQQSNKRRTLADVKAQLNGWAYLL